jgi:integrase
MALFGLAVQTGLRASELIGLRCSDVHLGSGAHVGCNGKGRKERVTPLTSNTVAVLRPGWPSVQVSLVTRCSQHRVGAPSVVMRLSADLQDMSRMPPLFVHPWHVSG